MKIKRVLFVYRNVMGIPYIDFGIASLSAFLKSKGHKTGLIDFTFGLNNKEAVNLATRLLYLVEMRRQGEI